MRSHIRFKPEILSCVQQVVVPTVRPVTLTRNYTKHAEGSVLVEFGDTKVLCTASIDEGVPRFLKGRKADHRRIWHVTACDSYP